MDRPGEDAAVEAGIEAAGEADPATWQEDVRVGIAAAYPIIAAAALAEAAEAIERIGKRAYDPAVFPAPDAQTILDAHAGFAFVGVSVDNWSAEIMRHGYRACVDIVRSLATPPTEGTQQ